MDFAFIEKTLRPNYYKKQRSIKSKYVGLPPQTYFNFLSIVDVNIPFL
jgi:hypothetical protein